MGNSIERTITLVWDEEANSWRDKYSHKKVDIIPPVFTLGPAPLQDEQLREVVEVAIGKRVDELQNLRELILEEWLPRVVERALTERAIPKYPVYFFKEEWFVTFGWLSDELRNISDRFNRIEQRTTELERPWWKRWLTR